MPEVINYDELVSNYYENLHTTLRKFSPGPDFLESWVHDEDHNRSLLGITESASDCGVAELVVNISPKVGGELNQKWINENLGKYGTVSIKDNGTSFELKIQFASKKKADTVHPAYLKGLEAAARKISYPGSFDESEVIQGNKLISVDADGAQLSVLVDDKGVVTNARHSGAQGLEAGLLDLLCKELVGRPFQEGAEHGPIRLEYALREPGVPLPVKGLLTPDNADPIFHLATKLVRNAFHTYLKATGKKIEWNEWEDALTAKWAALNEADRVALATKELNQIAQDLKLPYTNFPVINVRHDVRLTIALDANASNPKYGMYLMQLERELKKRVDKRLELCLEGLEDKNNRESRTKREKKFE